jgi:hypothetical protein
LSRFKGCAIFTVADLIREERCRLLPQDIVSP